MKFIDWLKTWRTNFWEIMGFFFVPLLLSLLVYGTLFVVAGLFFWALFWLSGI